MLCCVLQATLFGNLSGKELQTMVSTSELQKTSGTVSGRPSTPPPGLPDGDIPQHILFVFVRSVSAQADSQGRHQGLRRWQPGRG